MKLLVTLMLGASALLVANTAFAQARRPPANAQTSAAGTQSSASGTWTAQAPSATQTITSLPDLNNSQADVMQPHPLFNIGDVPVGIWAPVEPSYDSRMNRSEAANPVWDANPF
jgi:hypothetical protein